MKQGYALLLAAFLAAAATAEDRSVLQLTLDAGGAWPTGPGSFSDTFDPGQELGFGAGYVFSERWSAGARFANLRFGSDSDQSLTVQPVTAWARRSFRWTRRLTPFAGFDAGFSRNRHQSASLTDSAVGWTLSGGGGLLFRATDLTDLGLEASWRHVDRAWADGRAAQSLRLALVLTVYLPESRVPLKPPEDITMAELELPPDQTAYIPELDEGLVTQGEIELLQQRIESGDFDPIQFEPGTTFLRTNSFNALDTLAGILRRHPDVRVKIYGYLEADYEGDAGPALALARAEVVRTYLVRNFPILEARLFVEGTKPLPPPEAGQPEPEPSRRMDFEALPENP